jgi:uncharacterized membrane protein YcjF (UPF0283 family)
LARNVAGEVLSTHCDVPVAQLVTAAMQGVAGIVHSSPALQAWQTPALHTWSAPHVVPLSSGVPGVVLSTHCDVPVAQLVTAAMQGVARIVHSSPALQTWQVPVLQT